MKLTTDERLLVRELAEPNQALWLPKRHQYRSSSMRLYTLVPTDDYTYYGEHVKSVPHGVTAHTIDSLVDLGVVYRRPSNCGGWGNADIATLVAIDQLPEDVRLFVVQLQLGGL